MREADSGADSIARRARSLIVLGVERERCPAHGLVIGEGGCVRCRNTASARTTRNVFVGLGVFAFVACGAMAAVRAVTMIVERPSSYGALARPEPGAPRSTAARREPAPIPANASREEQLAAEMKNVPVTVYSADYCPWCRKEKAYLDGRGIAYDELHVDTDKAASAQMRKIGGRGIPTVDVEGDVHSGYDPAWLERTLHEHAEKRLALLR